MIALDLEDDFDGDDGLRRKDSALDGLAARRAALVRRAQRALLEATLEYGEASIDDVREVVKVPAAINPTFFGTVPTALARAGIIGRCGFATTKRATAHARPISQWELLDREGALDWLAEHPPLRDPGPPALRQRWLILPEPNAGSSPVAPDELPGEG